jgi:hypothetical protein
MVIIQGVHLTQRIYSPQSRKERKENFIFLFAVDPPKIPADRKDGKQKASEASLHLMVIESYNMRPPQLSEYLSLSKLA